MGKALVIVESPAKARTIGGMLGPDFIVESSVGHIRDLPRGADEVPAAYKGEAWARLGVDVDNGFKPLYVVSAPKKSVVANLKRLLKTADELYLATDEDREGESIAWHLSEVLSPTVPVKRMVFHEITPAAIARAVDDWRDLDRRLVDAQEARRILDRLYGYEVSPGAVAQGHAAAVGRPGPERGHPHGGRARAGPHALPLGHLVGDRRDVHPHRRAGRLRRHPGRAWAAGPSPPARTSTTTAAQKGTAPGAGRGRGHLGGRRLAGPPFTVRSVTEKPFRRSPAAPFMTSTLQQEAGRKLRFSAQRAMQVAQRLYEQGFITYMRTDSTTLSDQALTAARTQARQMYGDDYVPDAAAALRAQGQERPGGARGHPPGRRDLPHPRAGRP